MARRQAIPLTADKPSVNLGESNHKSTIPVYRMPQVSQRQANEREEQIQEALRYYAKTKECSIKHTAELFGVPYSILRGRLSGRTTRTLGHEAMQLLTKYEENSIVQCCKKLDEWGHPPRLAVVKTMALALIHRRANSKNKTLGVHWLTRFLDRHPQLASKLSTRLDRQWAFASNTKIPKDYFSKVCIWI